MSRVYQRRQRSSGDAGIKSKLRATMFWSPQPGVLSVEQVQALQQAFITSLRAAFIPSGA